MLKAVAAGLVIGLALIGTYALQEVNYEIGSAVGLLALFTSAALLMKGTRK